MVESFHVKRSATRNPIPNEFEMDSAEQEKRSMEWFDPTEDFWAATSDGVALAMAIYPFLIFAYVLSKYLLAGNSFVQGLPGVLLGFGMITVIALIARAMAKVLCTMYAVLIAKFLVNLELIPERLWVATFVGGLVGFTMILSLALPLVARFDSQGWTSLISATGFCLTATIAGQIGAIYGSRLPLIAPEERDQESWQLAKPRFSLLMLMGIMLGISVALSVLTLIGIPLDALFILFSLWFCGQAITLAVILLSERGYVRLTRPRQMPSVTQAD